ncbi:serine protease inhibitor 88Ea-like [Contarinia nasturtii]|uniref:serine protease inhibitor 88Ea-like n=1 Tax=Contarinia nasturtii TaxID=265458 RepID=UPI0012D48B2B|nr:serine protease inhibitor 88Ea-like [Contarinia nasturtii]
MKKSVIFIIIAIFAVIAVATILFQNKNSIKRYIKRHFHDFPDEKRDYQPYFGQLNFAISLLDSLQKENPNQNIVYSPHSIYQALLLVYFGAGGETEEELKHYLGLNWAKSKDEVANIYKLEKQVRDNRFRNQSIILYSVNRLYVAQDIILRDSVKRLLNDSIEHLNFVTDPYQCIQHINQFVANVTKGHIKNVIDGGINLMFVIVNALYFQGKWANNFYHTGRNLFYPAHGKPVYVDMMQGRRSAEYGVVKSLDVQYLKLPYEGAKGSISMYIFLPNIDSVNIDEILEDFTAEILDYVFSGVRSIYGDVDIKLPKFTIEKQFHLESVMQRMGMKNLFKNPNFSDLFESKERKLNTKLVHKAKINVDERGTIAVATTGSILWPISLKYYKDFYCNQPFLYVIHDQKFKEILFAGIYYGPNL